MNQQLKELKEYWYNKLAEDGFEDIENTKSPYGYLKIWHSSLFVYSVSPTEFLETHEYYQMADCFRDSFDFDSLFDKQVWDLHCEGMSARSIARVIGSNRWAVDKVVTKLTKLMKSGLYV